jgi:SAM-dependent methyltransferase
MPPRQAIEAARRAFRRGGEGTAARGGNGTVRQIGRQVRDLADCAFYHVVELPGGELTQGEWDLRASVDEYLGGIDVAGKSVIEIGPATGFLSFHMERRGASVCCVEPPMDAFWDLVPRPDIGRMRQGFADHIARIRNSFWYLHRIYDSKVAYYEADLFNLPADIPKFDIALFGSVLLHCRSPLKLLETVGKLVTGEIVITERYFADLAGQPVCRLVPSRDNGVSETWWEYSPQFFEQFLAIVGFPRSSATRHRQWYAAGNGWVEMFTLVAAR